MPKNLSDHLLAVIDVETDPFKFGRIPKPFAAAFFDGEMYVDFWGDDCITALVDFILARNRPYVIYAHNGGKFDFFFMLDHLENPLKIINGRIVEAQIGMHSVRDSYAILPIPLREFEKDAIDYTWFEESQREKHRGDILHYLSKDCEYLFKLVSAFNKRFGYKLTVGGTAISQLQKLHKFARGNELHDGEFRPYYFGGRVEAFESGELRGRFKIYDVNSMYPDVMRNKLHPSGRNYSHAASPRLTTSGKLSGFGNRPFFIRVIGKNHGAFATRTKDGLNFNVEYGEFAVMSHELEVALKHGRFEPHKIVSATVPKKTISFGDYVDKFMAEKIDGKKIAKETGDKSHEIFAKLLLNSAYGKFAQNPSGYFDYEITDTAAMSAPWQLYEIVGKRFIWRKPADSEVYLDVAIAASITSASRAKLLDAICTAKRPIYCDTDSIVCESFKGPIHESELGAWKLEAECDRLAIAGKKLYAAFKGNECVKMASKGARLEPGDIVKLARGEIVRWQNDAVSFSLSNPTGGFVEREIVGAKFRDEYLLTKKKRASNIRARSKI